MRTFLLETARILVSGIVAAIAWAVGTVIAFGPAQRFLADPERQSAKFLSVLTEEPLPRATENPEVLVYGLLIVGLIHACVYAWLDSRLSGGVVRKGFSFGLIAWALMVPWFEFYLPWNVMHEPLPLVLLEGFCWLIVLIGVGLSLSSVYGILSRVGKPSST
jgi:hypothetical protein